MSDSYPILCVTLTLEQAHKAAADRGYNCFWYKGGLYPMKAAKVDRTKAQEYPIVGWQFMPGQD